MAQFAHEGAQAHVSRALCPECGLEVVEREGLGFDKLSHRLSLRKALPHLMLLVDSDIRASVISTYQTGAKPLGPNTTLCITNSSLVPCRFLLAATQC